MDVNLYNHLMNSRKQGVEAGILIAKIKICKWLLDNNFNSGRPEIASYILNLQIDQREYEQNEGVTNENNKEI